MKLYSSHNCCCLLCAIKPYRRSCTCSRHTPSTFLPSGCTYACTCAMGYRWMKVWLMSKVGVLYGCFLPIVPPLFHVSFSSSSSGYNSHFFFEFNSLCFLNLCCSYVRYVLLRSTYTGRLTQFPLKSSTQPNLISNLAKPHQTQTHPPPPPSSPIHSHFSRKHHRGRVELTTEFLLKLSWSCPAHVTKFRETRNHNIMPADKTVCACNRKDGERRKDETSAEKALFHGTKATPSRHC